MSVVGLRIFVVTKNDAVTAEIWALTVWRVSGLELAPLGLWSASLRPNNFVA